MAQAVKEPGHHGLEIVHNIEDADVDIVAVHGLGATSAHSWRFMEEVNGKKTGKIINWLQDDDMLPSQIPKARIIAFNYNSDWVTKGTKIELWDLGTELMRELAYDRERSPDQKIKQRPIIFIGHSFGGIIIEQGLVNASFAGSDSRNIPKCTAGVICLGTPHQGSESAQWGSLIANITNAFGLGGEPTLVNDLNRGSETLKRIIHQYLMWVTKYSVDIAQFYETKQTNYGTRINARWNQMVVTKESACLPGYEQIPLLSDHFKLAKYSGPTDPSYMKVMPVIKKMADRAQDKVRLRFEPRQFIQDNSQIPAVNLECQKALFISWPDAELQNIKRRLGKRTPETCEWLLVKPDYTKWLHEKRPQLLRLVGNPGMGKSMIITFLVQELTETLKVTPDMTMAFHFCDNRNQSSNTATAVVRQLLFQLFQQRPKHFHLLQKAYDIAGSKLFQDFDTLWKILLDVIKVYGEGELYLLIDALDECDVKSRKLLMEGMHQITKDDLNVRVFFTCRPEADIENQYRKPNDRTLSLIVKGSDIDADIQKYMADKVPELCERHGWGDAEIKLITDTLMDKANSIFLWCSFVLQDIDKVEMKDEIQQCLNDLPPDLQGVYERITTSFQPKSKDIAKMILKIVTGARRPLKVDELTMTYVLADGSPRNWKDKILPPKSETSKFDDVFLSCGRLLYLDEVNHTVNLVHQSAKDYLLASYLIAKGLNDSREKFPENTRDTNIRMNNLFLQIIFRYFKLTTFEHLKDRMVFDAEWNVDWECSWWEMEPSPPFMVYCGREWELHAEDAEGHAEDGETDDMDCWNGHIRDSTRNSWLRRAATKGNKRFVEWLLENGAQIDSADFRGWNSLQLAAKNGKEEVIEFLVTEKGADIDAPAAHIDGRTPIQTAAEEGLDDVIRLLLRLKADINSPPAKINGRTALQAAAEKARISTIKLLFKHRELDPDSPGAEVSGVTALLAGAGSGGEWQMGKNIHRTIKQRSRLPGSAEIDTQKIAEEDQQDRTQRQKEETDHEDVVELLVDGGAHLIPNQFNWTALHAAVERESDKMVQKMLDDIDDVNFDVRGYHDGTPLHSAKAKANEQLAKLFEDKNATDPCTYSKLDLDAMMKYIRAVLTRLMIKSNTERFFFIQSYIPIYHVIYSYCAEGADDQNDVPPVENGGRRGELVYRGVDAWLKSYVKWNQKFIFDTSPGNDFLTVYLREWKLFKRGAYYVGRMLRYLTRHWVKHQRDKLNHKDVHEIAELFFHRWRAGQTGPFRERIKERMRTVKKEVDKMEDKDTRVPDAINESLKGDFEDFKDIFESAREYFQGFKMLKWDAEGIHENFEVVLRELSDEFEVQSEVWKAEAPDKPADGLIRNKKKQELLTFNARAFKEQIWSEDAANFFLDTVEPHFLAPYSGGKTVEIRRDLDKLWDLLRHDSVEAEERARRRAQNLNAAAENAEIEVGGDADGEDTHMTNGIPQTPLKERTQATA